MNVKDELSRIIGAENVSDDQETLDHYSTDESLNPPGTPGNVVYPENTVQVQEVVKFCNEHALPVIPCSSRVHFRGGTIPKQGGVILDFQKMNRILSINERNRYVMVEPGVTWAQIQSELAGRDLMVSPPLLPHPEQSVVSTFLEREPLVISLFEYNEPLMSMEVVWPEGSVFRTGSASAPNFPKTFVEGTNPMGPGTLDFFRLLQGAQGTMGIVTWAMVKAEYLAPESRSFFMGFDRVEKAIEPLYLIQRKKIGYECFLMNQLELACILAGEEEDIENLKKMLPKWTLLIILRSARRRPDEKFAYEEDALKEIQSRFYGMKMASSLPGLPNSGTFLAEAVRKPCAHGTYWKHRYQGSCEELFFITKPSKVPEFVDAMLTVAGRKDFPVSKMGCYVQPIENGRACHLEFDFFYDKKNRDQVDVVSALVKEASETLLARGAFFTRLMDPFPIWYTAKPAIIRLPSKR